MSHYNAHSDDDTIRVIELLALYAALSVLATQPHELHTHIANTHRRLVTLEVTLQYLRSLSSYQPQYSPIDNGSMAFGSIADSVAMVRPVLAADCLADAKVVTARYLDVKGVPFDGTRASGNRAACW
jgi:hypothetical protein